MYDELSRPLSVTLGVLQRTVLSLIFFILYINGLIKINIEAEIVRFVTVNSSSKLKYRTSIY